MTSKAFDGGFARHLLTQPRQSAKILNMTKNNKTTVVYVRQTDSDLATDGAAFAGVSKIEWLSQAIQEKARLERIREKMEAIRLIGLEVK